MVNTSFVSKCVGYAYALGMKLRFEKTFKGGKRPLKYLFMKGEDDTSNSLLIVFSSCTRKGVPARYNYVKTLSSVACPKLFVLDEYGPERRGCYYLGEDGDFDVYESTRGLIDLIVRQLGAKHRIYCGSSKGGWAALDFGIGDPDGAVVVGAPQYRLGDYLKRESSLPEGNRDLLPYICGEREALVEELNNRVETKLLSGSSNQPVFLCYSRREHTYDEHIEFLRRDLRKAGRLVYEKECDFEDHGQIGRYFAPFLKATVEAQLQRWDRES